MAIKTNENFVPFSDSVTFRSLEGRTCLTASELIPVEIYSHTVNIEKISICLNSGREKLVGNDDISIVCARKYEMVRMT